MEEVSEYIIHMCVIRIWCITLNAYIYILLCMNEYASSGHMREEV